MAAPARREALTASAGAFRRAGRGTTLGKCDNLGLLLVATAFPPRAMPWFRPVNILWLTLATAAVGSALADRVPLDLRIDDPHGALLAVSAIDLGADAVVLSVTITNPGNHELRLNRDRGFVLTDEAHGVHHLNPPPDNPELVIPRRARLAGDLVFIGPVAPAARQLTLSSGTLNATLPITDQSAARAATQVDHPEGVALRLRHIVATPTACVVSLLATNGSDRTIVLNQNRGLVLTDKGGVAAPLKAPTDNRELVVPSGNRLDAELLFDCHSIDAGGKLTLGTRRETAATGDAPDETSPGFTVEATAERQMDAATPAASSAAVAPIAWSHLAPAAETLAAAAADGNPATPLPAAKREPPSASAPANPGPHARAEIEAALHAAKTDRGWRILLPAGTLFAAASAALDAKAASVLEQLAGLIAATHPQEVVVAGHGESADKDADNQALSKERAHAVVLWLGAHLPKQPPQFVEKGYGRNHPVKPDRGAHPDDAASKQPDGQIEILLRRDHLVPNSRSPASPSPGKI